MRDLTFAAFLLCGLSSALAPTAHAQPNSARLELSALVGGAKIPDTSFSNPGAIAAQVSTTENNNINIGWQANIGWHVFNWGPAAVLLDVPLTSALSQNPVVAVTFFGETNQLFSPKRNTYFVAPGFRFRFLNHKRLSPFFAGGVGIESTNLEETKVIISASSSLIAVAAIRHGSQTYKGAFDFGGGLDLNLQQHVSLRFDFRDFVRMGQTSSQSGTTAVIQDALPSRHTLAPLAGVVFRF